MLQYKTYLRVYLGNNIPSDKGQLKISWLFTRSKIIKVLQRSLKRFFLQDLFLFEGVIKVQDIIIRNATIEDIEKIADIKIEGWQTAYRGIIDDDFLDNMDRKKEIEKKRKNIDNGVNIIVAELKNN